MKLKIIQNLHSAHLILSTTVYACPVLSQRRTQALLSSREITIGSSSRYLILLGATIHAVLIRTPMYTYVEADVHTQVRHTYVPI